MLAFMTADGRTETASNLRLAIPLVAAQLVLMAFGVIDTVMAGHISPAALAAVAVGHNTWIIPFMFFLGVLTSISPIVAQRVGAGQSQAQIGRFARQALALAAVLGLLWLAIIWVLARPVIELLGLPADTTDLAVRYLYAEGSSALPFALTFAQRNFIEGQGYSRPILFAGLCGLAVKIFFNIALVQGRFGMPAYGVIGCGWSTVISTTAMAGVYAALLQWLPRVRDLGVFSARPLFTPEVLEVFRVGLPLAFIFMAEGCLFGAAGLMMARFGQDPVAGHQIAINFASVVFMVPMGLGMATTVRVGQAAGAGNKALARMAGQAGMSMGLCFALFSATVMGVFPGAIAAVYTTDAEITPYAITFLRLAALFQLFDCLQVTANGALRGLKDTRVPMAITLVAYWPIGFAIAWTLAFHSGVGPAGIWYGFIAGLAGAALGLASRFLYKTRARPALV